MKWFIEINSKNINYHFYNLLAVDCFVPEVKSGLAIPPTNDTFSLYSTDNQQIASGVPLPITDSCICLNISRLLRRSSSQ